MTILIIFSIALFYLYFFTDFYNNLVHDPTIKKYVPPNHISGIKEIFKIVCDENFDEKRVYDDDYFNINEILESYDIPVGTLSFLTPTNITPHYGVEYEYYSDLDKNYEGSKRVYISCSFDNHLNIKKFKSKILNGADQFDEKNIDECLNKYLSEDKINKFKKHLVAYQKMGDEAFNAKYKKEHIYIDGVFGQCLDINYHINFFKEDEQKIVLSEDNFVKELFLRDERRSLYFDENGKISTEDLMDENIQTYCTIHYENGVEVSRDNFYEEEE